MISFPDAFRRLLAAPSVDAALVRDAFEAILRGEWTPVQTGAFAAALRVRGETVDALVEAARALRAHMAAVEHGLPLVMDTCGTGGDSSGTLNVSTASAIIVAAAGVPVAKHGNRSISSQCGSADVLEALGIPIDTPLDRAPMLLREIGIAFLFAPAHHPALRHAAQARRELGVRTIFNALGPAVNPARATHQLVGVYDDALRPMLARVLFTLGSTRAWVVHSEDGLDEISPAAPTRVSVVENGRVTDRVIAPEDFGVERRSVDAIAGGTPSDNAVAIEAILMGADRPGSETILLNAAAALLVAGTCTSPRDALALARETITSGKAERKLAAWRAAVQK